jgi:hypothetical protein
LLALLFPSPDGNRNIMMKISSALGGLAGACALTLLNEGVKKIDKNAPRLDLLGMNAAAKLIKGSGFRMNSTGQLMPASLAGDLVSNSLYYAMANTGNKKSTLFRGAMLGLGAGIGAVTLAKPLGLDERAANSSLETKAMIIAWYVVGGLIAAAVTNLIDKKNPEQESPARTIPV